VHFFNAFITLKFTIVLLYLVSAQTYVKGEFMKKLLVLGTFIVAGFAYSNCAMCHNGGMAKKLDSMTSAEIVKKMKEYKAGQGNPMMVNIAKGMSDKEIEEAAKKFGKK